VWLQHGWQWYRGVVQSLSRRQILAGVLERVQQLQRWLRVSDRWRHERDSVGVCRRHVQCRGVGVVQ
jgi:hypothetical protein